MLDRAAPSTPVQAVLCTPGQVVHYMLAQVARAIQGLVAPVMRGRAGLAMSWLK
jgi:hypothetical protein